jgi:CheY-like chemotaxis protein
VSRPAPAPPPPAAAAGLLPYDMFAAAARVALAKGPAALLLVKVAAPALETLGARCSDDLRRRDILGRVDGTHLVLLAPDQSPAAARAAMQAIIERAPAMTGTAIGAADSSAVAAGAGALDAMLAHADLALAAERVAQSGGQPGRITVLLCEDDPDVMHIIDARLRAGGYRTVLALDGQQTLDALTRETPAVVLLDLMMPKLTGFDVLMRLRERTGPRPKTIVVSARGRDEDVTRAFELGADDYVTKPFNPEELMARIARLVR